MRRGYAGEGEPSLHFTVTDTGIGVPAEKQHAIFEAFMQADNSVARKYGGTGLGLAISSRLVQMMRGNLWVESEPGEGTTFHFTADFETRSSAEQVPASLPALSQLAAARVHPSGR